MDQACLSGLPQGGVGLLQMLQMRRFHLPLLPGRQLLTVEGRSTGRQRLLGSLLDAHD
ncbi:hypothetical protein D3C76_1180730 [compost metagenome]